MSDKKTETKKTDKPSELTDTDVEQAVGGKSSFKAGNTVKNNKHQPY